mgnify:CR=1 FL=1
MSGTGAAVLTYSAPALGVVSLNPYVPQEARYKCVRRNERVTVDFVGAFDGYKDGCKY